LLVELLDGFFLQLNVQVLAEKVLNGRGDILSVVISHLVNPR